MKNALILHGTSSSPDSNWFPWLKRSLEEVGYKVWVPQLPNADKPNMSSYREFIFNSNWEFNEDSVIIGHSSGAVAALFLLEALAESLKINTAVMVGVYRPEKEKYSTREPIDINKVKGKANRFAFIHSDNDPFCSLDYAKYYSEKLNGELIILPGQEHFSSGGREAEGIHTELPKILEIL